MSDREQLSDDECIGYARCAASYWADILRVDRASSVIRDAGHSNTGSMSFHGEMLALQLHAARPSPTRDACDAFEDALFESLLELLKRGCFPFFGVDYAPDRILADAMKKSGVGGALPFKHRMYLSEDGVSVSPGYRAESVQLVETKRAALRRAVGAKHWQDGPYVKHIEHTDSTEPIFEAWDRRGRLLADVMKPLPAMPVGKFEEIVEGAWAFISGETDVPPWPFTRRDEDSPA